MSGATPVFAHDPPTGLNQVMVRYGWRCEDSTMLPPLHFGCGMIAKGNAQKAPLTGPVYGLKSRHCATLVGGSMVGSDPLNVPAIDTLDPRGWGGGGGHGARQHRTQLPKCRQCRQSLCGPSASAWDVASAGNLLFQCTSGEGFVTGAPGARPPCAPAHWEPPKSPHPQKEGTSLTVWTSPAHAVQRADRRRVEVSDHHQKVVKATARPIAEGPRAPGTSGRPRHILSRGVKAVQEPPAPRPPARAEGPRQETILPDRGPRGTCARGWGVRHVGHWRVERPISDSMPSSDALLNCRTMRFAVRIGTDSARCIRFCVPKRGSAADCVCTNLTTHGPATPLRCGNAMLCSEGEFGENHRAASGRGHVAGAMRM